MAKMVTITVDDNFLGQVLESAEARAVEILDSPRDS
jgi:hypothetical protein